MESENNVNIYMYVSMNEYDRSLKRLYLENFETKGNLKNKKIAGDNPRWCRAKKLCQINKIMGFDRLTKK